MKYCFRQSEVLKTVYIYFTFLGGPGVPETFKFDAYSWTFLATKCWPSFWLLALPNSFNLRQIINNRSPQSNVFFQIHRIICIYCYFEVEFTCKLPKKKKKLTFISHRNWFLSLFIPTRPTFQTHSQEIRIKCYFGNSNYLLTIDVCPLLLFFLWPCSFFLP